MKAKSSKPAELEPVGIVISRGPVVEHAPTFFAYVWSADPEPEPITPITHRAA